MTDFIKNILTRILTILLASAFGAAAFAEQGVSDNMQNAAQLADLTLACKYKKSRLDIRLSYADAEEGKMVPCSVSYQRNQSAPLELWKTDSDEGFCESRLKMFVDKLLSEDWSCKETYLEE